jgi:hypothetical protein
MDYETLQPGYISFLPPGKVMEAYKNDYKIMKEQMIYGEAGEFEKLIGKLIQLNNRVLKNNNELPRSRADEEVH